LASSEESLRSPASPSRPPQGSSTVDIVIDGRIDRADIAALCERVGVALEASGADLAICDVGALVDPDCAAVDALARVQLTAKRLGRQMRLRNTSPELRELLWLAGLSDVCRSA
jgi:anti-anti-sigma regulatory factor